MRIFQTSTLRYKDFDELIVDEQGAFKMIEFVAPMDKAELLEDLMRKFAADNRELLASAQE
jgi:hypothetical protein